MEFVFFILVIAIILRPFTVLFHELGHGITALLLTKEKVTLYIGSYGDPKNSFKFSLGRLEFFIKYFSVLWEIGLCVHQSKNIPLNRQILITLFGPIASLLLGGIFCYIAFAGNLDDNIKKLSLFFIVSAVFDFIHNIVPRNEPTQLYDGTIVYNDGQQLIQLFKYKTLPSQWMTGTDFYHDREFAKAARVFQEIIDSGLKNEIIYELAIVSYMGMGDYKTAKSVQEEFAIECKLTSDNYVNSGLIESNLENYDESQKEYKKSLDLDENNKWALNNRGYNYNLMGEYENALVDLDKAIRLDPEFAYAYDNRGLTKIKLGQMEDGYNDIQRSLELDDQNAEGYRNLGIYYFEKEEYSKALENFQTAFELDEDTPLITDYLDKTKEKLKA